MASYIKAVSFDAADARALAAFWAAARDPEGSEFCVEPGPEPVP
ncbi:MAG: hypothetical protein ACRDOH_05865 [Streptosporangiaceae bacterium]